MVFFFFFFFYFFVHVWGGGGGRGGQECDCGKLAVVGRTFLIIFVPKLIFWPPFVTLFLVSV
jgi:hypothetical protein